MANIVVIPACNEKQTIAGVVTEALSFSDKVIVVDDCSLDDTGLLAEAAGAFVLRNKQNLGYDKSLEAGMICAIEFGAHAILTIDADGQHPSQYIPTMFELVNSGSYDLVIGHRPTIPRVGERIFSYYTNLRYGVLDITCGFKCYSTHLFLTHGFVCGYRSIGTYLTLKALSTGASCKSISVPIAERVDASRFGGGLRPNLAVLNAMLQSFFI